MTSKTDSLVERLRSVDYTSLNGAKFKPALLTEAADEIAALKEQLRAIDIACKSVAEESETVKRDEKVAREALAAVEAKLAEYLERVLQRRTVPNDWVRQINTIVQAAKHASEESP